MGFDFFKKKGKDRENGDDLEFDDLEASGEFLSSGTAPPNAPRQDPPPPPPPLPQAPPPPPVHSSPPPPPPPPVRPPDLADDVTIVNAPAAPMAPPPPPVQQPVAPPPAYAAPPQPAAPGPPAPPAPPGPPGPPAPPAPPSPPQAAPQPPQYAPPVPPPSEQVTLPPPPYSNAPGGQPGAPQAPPPIPPGMDDEVTQVLSTPVANEALVAWLVIAAGDERGKDFRLPNGTIRLGQSPACEICLQRDTFISTQHAELVFRGGTFWVKDLNSTNGTFVNNVPASEVALNDGDRVKVGMTEMIFKSLKL